MSVLSIIIPVYNEKESIFEIVKKVEAVKFLFDIQIILVDDYSTDGTRELLKRLEDKHIVLYHAKNLGKGSAIRTGLASVTGEYVVIQDADLEYDPADLKKMLEKMKTESLSVLYGSRRLNKGNVQYSGVSYYMGGMFLTVLTNLLYRQKITDEPTCYKMFKTDLLKSLPLKCKRFEFCPEVTALVSKKGIFIKEIPISYFPRKKEEGKKICLQDGLEATFTLLKYVWKKK